MELLNKYHQRAKADLVERARLKACVAVPGSVEEVAQESAANRTAPGCEGPRMNLEAAHDLLHDETPPSSRRTSGASVCSHTVKRRFSDMRAPRTLSEDAAGESSEDDVTVEARSSAHGGNQQNREGPLNRSVGASRLVPPIGIFQASAVPTEALLTDESWQRGGCYEDWGRA